MWGEVSDVGTQQHRSERHPKRFTAWFGTHGYTHEGQTLNLSDRGIALKGSSVFPSGTRLRIAVKPSDQPAFELDGVVVWARSAADRGGQDGEMGIRLSKETPRYSTFISRTRESAAFQKANPSSAASFPPRPLPALPLPTSVPPSVIITAAPSSLPPVAPAAPVRDAVSFDAFLSASMPVQPGTPSGTMSVVTHPPSYPKGVQSLPPSPGMGRIRMPRFDDQLPVRWGVSGLENRGFTVNMSRTGIAFRTEKAVQPGARLNVAVTLPEGTTARATGVATWQRLVGEPGVIDVGLRLLHADVRYFGLIDELARRR
jgi:hypothetical protein